MTVVLGGYNPGPLKSRMARMYRMWKRLVNALEEQNMADKVKVNLGWEHL